MEDMKNTVEAVEALVENNEVMTEVVKKGLTLSNKKVVYMVAAAISAGATYVVYKKLQEKAKAKTEDTEKTETPDPNDNKVKIALLKSAGKCENCEIESPKFEPDENR